MRASKKLHNYKLHARYKGEFIYRCLYKNKAPRYYCLLSTGGRFYADTLQEMKTRINDIKTNRGQQ